MKIKSFHLLVAFFFIVMLFESCFQLFNPGPATKIKVAYNPNKTKQAILFLKGGNATVADSYQVSIKDAGDDLACDDAGNAFRVDEDHGKTTLSSNSINFKWLAANQLVISYDKKLRTFIQLNRVGSVNIIYQPR